MKSIPISVHFLSRQLEEDQKRNIFRDIAVINKHKDLPNEYPNEHTQTKTPKKGGRRGRWPTYEPVLL